ncbi:hypothetical protein [Roseofilum capinflatum]|uniref:Uncharacterized protein n=1 Tax=Roseofilum capinflatum BLCC-M114 TaxID=3022440 RepID=A0ABT7BC78_9CYAN|nr:hypothetical protein [Roseofilum capinflatum]MDJ1176789.1 hypothetical protein [Roseofilum capinflatum BLCC-M114]
MNKEILVSNCPLIFFEGCFNGDKTPFSAVADMKRFAIAGCNNGNSLEFPRVTEEGYEIGDRQNPDF